jgi:hypothetical protein
LKSAELACPRCGDAPDGDASFCARCGMPLVASEGASLEEPLSEAHGRARKIDPRYADGRLVRVAGGHNQAEAELIQGLLLEEGVPSMLRRTPGFDVPDFLAAGPRDVLVPESGADVARELLHQTRWAPAAPAAPLRPNPLKLAAGVVLGGAGAALIAWLLQG